METKNESPESIASVTVDREAIRRAFVNAQKNPDGEGVVQLNSPEEVLALLDMIRNPNS